MNVTTSEANGVYRLERAEDGEAFAARAEKAGLDVLEIDLAEASTKADWLHALSAAFELESPGKNWDSLYDSLTDPRERGVLVVLSNVEPLARSSPDDFADACAVLRAVADELTDDDTPFVVLVAGGGPTTMHLPVAQS